MSRNVEIKAHVKDLEAVKQRILALKKTTDDVCPKSTVLRQKDVFYNLPAGNCGKLKLRKINEGFHELIYYDREETTGPKLSSYNKCQVNGDIEELLTNALGMWGVVNKVRTLVMVDQTRVHFDSVDGLGDFVELEVVLNDTQTVEDGKKIANNLMSVMGVEEKDLISVSYVNMLIKNNS